MKNHFCTIRYQNNNDILKEKKFFNGTFKNEQIINFKKFSYTNKTYINVCNLNVI